MKSEHLTDREIARRMAQDLRAWRIDPRGAAMTQAELSSRSGIGLTPLKRFEKTGGITLNNLIAMFRALNLLDRLTDVIPKPATPSPLELLKADRSAVPRTRAPRTKRPPSPATEPGRTTRG